MADMTNASGMNRVSAAEMRAAGMSAAAVTTAAMTTAVPTTTAATAFLGKRRRGREAEREADHAKSRCNLRRGNPLHGNSPSRNAQRQIAPGVPVYPRLRCCVAADFMARLIFACVRKPCRAPACACHQFPVRARTVARITQVRQNGLRRAGTDRARLIFNHASGMVNAIAGGPEIDAALCFSQL